MRQAIRVYAIVALVAMVAFVAALWAIPWGFVGGLDWVARTLFYVFGLQLWVLLVIPLGVLAASDAARAGRRGWLALFVALVILAPLAAWISQLTNTIQLLIIGPCLPGAACPSGPLGTPQLITQAGWAVGFLPIPIAALVYSGAAARSVAGRAAAEVSQGERRALIVWAIAGIVVMGALGYLGTSPWSFPFLLNQFGHGSLAQTMTIFNLLNALNMIWIILAALPVAIASMALAHAARTGRYGWLATWIALAALALLAVDLSSLWGETLILQVTSSASGQISAQQYAVSITTPVVVMLVALLYARFMMRPGRSAAVLAVA